MQSRSQLSLLEILPPGPRSANREPSPPVLLASFSYVSDSFQHSPAHAVQATILCKWELQIATPKLHSSFNSLSSKKATASSVAELPVSRLCSRPCHECCLIVSFKPEILMKRSADILLPRALLSVQHINLRPVLAMVYCEGLIEYRETANMNVISRDANDQISSMAQIGLYFPRSRFCKSHKGLFPPQLFSGQRCRQFLTFCRPAYRVIS